MKNGVKAIGKILIYLLVYFVSQLIGGIIIGVYCAISYGGSTSQTKLIEIINSKIYYAATIGAVLALAIFIVAYGRKEEDLWKRCQFRKINLKTLMYSALAAAGTAMATCSILNLIQNYFKSYDTVSKDISTGISTILGIVCVVVLMPVFEEILFRGLIFNKLRRNMNLILSIILQALIFAVAHGNLLQGIYTFVLGTILAIVYMWTKSIWTNIILHITYNLMGSLVVPIALYYTKKFFIIYIIVGLALLIFALIKLHKSIVKEEICYTAEDCMLNK